MNQGYSSGGSTNSSQSVSQTFGTQASQVAQQVAAQSTASAHNAWREAAEYNAEQARIQREWQERMANSVYQRTVEDMKKAGINPILAAGMGLGTASVSGGSAASISPSQVYNAQTFADSMSANQAQGSSWQQSESGIMTLANALMALGQGMFDKLTSSQNINIAIDTIEKTAEASNPTSKEMDKDNYGSNSTKNMTTKKWYEHLVDGIEAGLKGLYKTQGGMGMIGR